MTWLKSAERLLIKLLPQLIRSVLLLSSIISCAHPASARERAEAQSGWLGLEMRTLTRTEMQALGLSVQPAAQVLKVEANSPAAKADLAPGDIILAADGRTFASAKHFFATIRATMPGTAIKLKVLRRGRQRSITALVGTRPGPTDAPATPVAPVLADAERQEPPAPQVAAPSEAAPVPVTTAPQDTIAPQQPAPVSTPAAPKLPGYLGTDLREVTDAESKELGWSEPHGAKVTGFAKESLAPAAGLLEGDIILSVNGMDVPNDDRFPVISRIPAGTTIPVKVLRDGKELEFKVTLAVRPKEAGPPLRLMLDTGGHMGGVEGVALTPDAKQIVSASVDKTIRVWDVEKGVPVRVIRGETGEGAAGNLFAMALSPDGRWLAAGGVLQNDDLNYAAAIRLYDFTTGKLVGLLHGHDDTIADLTFSPDSRKLLSGSYDDKAIIWDVAQRRELHKLEGHADAVTAVAFTHDGARAITGSEDETLRFWNPNDGQFISEMAEHGTFTKPEEGRERVWTAKIRSIAVSPKGDLIASGGDDGRVLLTDARTGKFLRELAFPGGQAGYHNLDGLSFSPDGLLLHASSVQEGCLLFDVETGGEVYEGNVYDRQLTLFDGVRRERCTGESAFSADGKLVVSSYNSQVQLLNVETSRAVKTFQTTGATIYGAGFSEDGRSIAWGTELGQSIDDIPPPLSHSFRLPIDGTPLTGAEKLEGDQGGFVRPSAKSGTKTVRFKPGENEYSHYPGIIQILEDGREPFEFKRDLGGASHRDQIAFAPDGQSILVKESLSIRQYDLTGKFVGAFSGQGTEFRAFAISPNSRFLIAGGADQTLRLWNRKTHELIVTLFPGRDGEWVMWTPQGYYASSPGADSSIGWLVNRGPERDPDYITGGQLRKHLNRPDIVARAIQLGSATEVEKEAYGTRFKLEDLLSKPVPRIRILSPAPETTVRGGKTEIQIQLDATPDPVRRLHVQVNGRQIADKLPEKGSGFAPGDHKLTVPLARGRNVVHIVAINDTGETPVNISIDHEGEGQLDKHGTLYILAVGVDRYPNLKGSDLRYSGADANAFASAMQQRSGPLHEKVIKRVLVSSAEPADQPSKANIENALGILASATENDTVMVFVAGHGINEGPSYRFLPADATMVEGRLLPATVVPWYAFQEAIETAKGRRILFLDTCHAGNAYNATLSNQAFYANITVYSAARWDQVALERPDLGGGHGLFTYSLVEGLNGAAKNDAGEVSTVSLRNFLARRVKELAASLNTDQEPQFYRGRDAPDYVLGRL